MREELALGMVLIGVVSVHCQLDGTASGHAHTESSYLDFG